ncbi:MAG: hypothetical protein SH807_10935 [Blastochloris sp.]|nr:hypothetical protein [Blastochloris sp.]
MTKHRISTARLKSQRGRGSLMVELYFGRFGVTNAIGLIVAGQETSPDFGSEHFHHNNTEPTIFLVGQFTIFWPAT